MDILTILLIALGLAMDCFAVAIASGKNIGKIKNAFMIAVFFGVFQAVMPIIGWFAGSSILELISGFDHWLVFLLLSFIGIKMIYESVKIEKEEKKNLISIYVLLVLAVATSIDALAVGLSLAFLNVSILEPAIIIGIVAFSMTLIGVYIGKKFKNFLGKKMGIAGGLILILIGIKILLEHLVI